MIIKGNVDLIENESLESLGELREVHGDLNLAGCYNLTTLGKLKIVKGFLVLHFCRKPESLGDLQKVGKQIVIYKSGDITESYLIHLGKFNYRLG